MPQDTLVLLHQMGNYGPAYYQRYPKEFEAFKPVCMINELSKYCFTILLPLIITIKMILVVVSFLSLINEANKTIKKIYIN